MSEHKIKVEASKWSQGKGAPYNYPIVVTIERIDLDDEEQVKETDAPNVCEKCGIAKDMVRMKFEVAGTPTMLIYYCPCANVWFKDLQPEEVEQSDEEVDTT